MTSPPPQPALDPAAPSDQVPWPSGPPAPAAESDDPVVETSTALTVDGLSGEGVVTPAATLDATGDGKLDSALVVEGDRTFLVTDADGDRRADVILEIDANRGQVVTTVVKDESGAWVEVPTEEPSPDPVVLLGVVADDADVDSTLRRQARDTIDRRPTSLRTAFRE